MAKSKLAKYRDRRKKSNPSQATEMAINIGAGFGGYAVTRFASRMAYSQLVKKYPDASKHIQVAASALGAAGVYFGTRYWKKVDDYHEAASIGAGIALLQTAVQAWFPKYGWIVSDANAEQYGAKKKRELPDADMTTLLPAAPEHELGPAPEANFDIDAFLADHSELEAVPIGQAPAVEEPEADDDMSFDDDDLENYNGLLS